LCSTLGRIGSIFHKVAITRLIVIRHIEGE
jgi:hypothetical protein